MKNFYLFFLSLFFGFASFSQKTIDQTLLNSFNYLSNNNYESLPSTIDRLLIAQLLQASSFYSQVTPPENNGTNKEGEQFITKYLLHYISQADFSQDSLLTDLQKASNVDSILFWGLYPSKIELSPNRLPHPNTSELEVRYNAHLALACNWAMENGITIKKSTKKQILSANNQLVATCSFDTYLEFKLAKQLLYPNKKLKTTEINHLLKKKAVLNKFDPENQSISPSHSHLLLLWILVNHQYCKKPINLIVSKP